MKIAHFLLALLCLCLATPSVFAQKNREKQRDVEIIDFGDTKTSRAKKEKYSGLIIKTSPSSFLFGRQPIELEKQINDFLSIQGGLGVTFAPLLDLNEISQELYPELNYYCESTQWAIDECDDYSDGSIRKGAIGPMVSFSPRLFFESDGFEGGYIAPVVRWSAQRFQVQEIQSGVIFPERTNTRQNEYIRSLDLMVHYGSQYLYPKLTLEYFLGVGARLNNSLRQDIGRDGQGLYQNGERAYKERLFRAEIGIRVGFQL